jgi:RNA polymerase sigma factor (sigma-70 family)
MRDGHLLDVSRRIEQLVDSQAAAHRTDAELLERVAVRAEPVAFEVLVRRHGPLVWRVCRRLLGHVHDAEDAFQAVFLVLARKAPSIRRGESLPGWLQAVAFRVARKARAQRRPESDIPEVVDCSHDPAAVTAAREQERLIEEEVQRLPQQYRLPVLFCYGEGLTNQEAARRLDWPVGTLKTRLAHARELLRQRLAGRGVTLTSTAVVAVLTAPESQAAVPAALLATTLRVAAVPAGRTAILAKEVMQTMTLTRLNIVSVLLLTLGLAAAALLPAQTLRPAKAEPSAAVDAPADRPKEKDDADPLPPDAWRDWGRRAGTPWVPNVSPIPETRRSF